MRGAQGPQTCLGSCSGENGDGVSTGLCYECFQDKVTPDDDHEFSFALDLGNARSSPGVDVVPTFTTSNDRICLLLSTQKMGMLRIEDAERLQGFPEGFTWSCYPIQIPGVNAHKGRQIKDSDVDIWESRRYALLGNAVTVKVAEWLGERLAKPHMFKYIPSDRDRALQQDFRNKHIAERQEMELCEDLETGLLIRSVKKITDQRPNDDCEEGMALLDYDLSIHGQNTHQKSAWPRAAWYANGIGRFGVEDISECPKKIPFQPLGQFITQVGKLPGPDVINTYIMRLREQGWNVENIVKKATTCGLNLIREVSEVVRLDGVPDDPDQIGNLVWCVCRITKTPIPDAAVQIEKKAWLPVEYWDEERVDETSKTDAHLRKEEALLNGQRKVCVVFFGDNCHDWVYAHETLDFEKHKDEKEQEAQALHDAGKEESSGYGLEESVVGSLKRPKLFFTALDDAKLWLAAKKSNRKNGRLASAVASRAASLAAAENKKPRCGNCEACLNKMSGGNSFSKRCLYVRAQAAAAGGHVGAQVAIHRHRALGAKLEVYWPLDQKWFPGIVTGFDRLRLRHTVLYEDGDREILALWSPCQLIRVLNQPKEWPAAAEEVHQREEELRLRKEQQKALAAAQATPLTELEANRRQMIQKNREILALMLEEGAEHPAGDASGSLMGEDRAFETVQEIHSSAEHVHATLGNLQESDPLTEESVIPGAMVMDPAQQRLSEVDVYSILDLGGPCRHTRSARRELTDFLGNEDSTPVPKKIKREEASSSEAGF